MREIIALDECNDTYGRVRMYQSLLLRNSPCLTIPSERTVYRVMGMIGLVHRPGKKPDGITKADRNARKSDDLLRRDFSSERPIEKWPLPSSQKSSVKTATSMFPRYPTALASRFWDDFHGYEHEGGAIHKNSGKCGTGIMLPLLKQHSSAFEY